MATLRVRLFGKLCVQESERLPPGLDSRKAQELLCFLLLNRQPHTRAALAEQLWADADSLHCKKSLRQALWQLQSALESLLAPDNPPLLQIDAEWIQLNPQAMLWADVIQLESAYAVTNGRTGDQLDERVAHALAAAVAEYRGDLLSGWYQDWCLFERERLQNLSLGALDKLIERSEARREYEAGVTFAVASLRYNPVRERTHRLLMRLYYLSGDRVAALRQYERCAAMLSKELGVEPARSTRQLYAQVQADQLDEPDPAPRPLDHTPSPATLLTRLHQLASGLASVQRQIQDEIQALEAPDSQRQSS